MVQGGAALSVRLWRDMAPEELAAICGALCRNVTLIAGGMEVATDAAEELALRFSENPAVYWVQVRFMCRKYRAKFMCRI